MSMGSVAEVYGALGQVLVQKVQTLICSPICLFTVSEEIIILTIRKQGMENDSFSSLKLAPLYRPLVPLESHSFDQQLFFGIFSIKELEIQEE